MNAESLVLILIVAAGYGTYNFFIKMGSGAIHQTLGAVTLQIVAALIGGGMLLVLWMKGETFPATPKGWTYAVLAGIVVGTTEILSFYLFSKGMTASIGIPLIVGGTALSGALLGIFILGETLSVSQYTGITLIVIGSMLLSR